MNLSQQTIGEILSRYAEDGQHVYDWASEYGEPGYHDRETHVVLGDWWCRCPEFGQERGQNKLHTIMEHRPRLFQALEDAGVEFVWHDEWMVNPHSSKAYRTQGDSYSWQSSVLFTDGGDPLTPDDDLSDWTDEIQNNPRMCLPARVWSVGDLTEAGWTLHQGRLESGWHPGQNDDPVAAAATCPEDHDYLFYLDSTGQFDIEFSMWVRPQD